MSGKYVAPSLGENRFNCPHCDALAQQNWVQLYYRWYEGDKRPFTVDAETVQNFKKKPPEDKEFAERVIEWATKMETGKPFLGKAEEEAWTNRPLENMYASQCYSCKDITVWRSDTIIYPPARYEVSPNPDLPSEVKLDFEEAALIVDKSPRGAAALLRLGLEKLVQEIGGDGKNINERIKKLVERGLPVKIQQALDIVRVIGNNAVHPGAIDLRDDRATALKLFGLINLIADTMVTQPKQIEAMFGNLPSGALEQIEQRDKPKANSN
jgi:hypothetical protein